MSFAPFSVPPPGAIPEWSEHRSPDGRTYYYNSVTKQSSWEKPNELKTPAERLLSACPWKEYTSESGKVYYYNTESKESKWTAPQEYMDLKAKVLAEKALKVPPVAPLLAPGLPIIAPPIVAAGTSPFPTLDAGANLTPGSAENSSSAMDQAMAATLAAIEMPETPKEDEPVEEKMPEAAPEVPVIEFKDKKEAIEAFKEFLKEMKIPSNCNWDQCVKIISKEPKYNSFKKLNEKKQAFNAYKTQKLKDEREEQRLRAKQSKENLEKFLMTTDKIDSTTKYYKCDEIFSTLEVWKSVVESDRRDIYEDCIFNLAKREREEAKILKKRNMKTLAELLESMPSITYQTTWSEAQVLLLENQTFKSDINLLGMDKEDALIVFEEHIRGLEREEEEEKEREKKRRRRLERKNRDAFLALLDSLHEDGKLTSMSFWVELYPMISADLRFSAMLGQTGSTPLDLFKFYVEDLKARFYDEKKIVKEILKARNFNMKADTTFVEFATFVCEDDRSANLDAGNVKLTYNALLEKAESAEKERLKKESRRIKEYANLIKNAWIEGGLQGTETFDVAQKLVEDKEYYEMYEKESKSKVEELWEKFMEECENTCSHHHSKSKKAKKNRKRKKRSRSNSGTPSEGSEVEIERSKKKERSRSFSQSSQESIEENVEKKKKKKKKHRRVSKSPTPVESEPASEPVSPEQSPIPKKVRVNIL